MLKRRIIVLIFFIAVCIINSCKPSCSSSKKIVSYIRTWGLGSTVEEIDKGNFWKAEDIAGDQLTTLNVAFGLINKDFDIYVKNFVRVGKQPGFKTLFKELAKIQKKNKDLRINLSIGGWGGDGFSDMALTKKSRAVFIKNVLKWVTKYNFKGVDIDWEYPVNGGWGTIKSRPEDKQNFTHLLRELKNELVELGKKTKVDYEISFAAAATPDYLTWIEPKKVAEIVDYIKVMAYDYFGSWNKSTGHHANLFGYKVGDKEADLSGAAVVDNYIKAGFPKHKILLGVPFYGRGWKGVSKENNGLGQPAKEAVYVDGITFPDVLKLMKEDKSFKRYWDDDAKAPYIYNGDVWITYEDKESLAQKIAYVKDKGLRGIMIWEYAHDMDEDLLGFINQNIK